MKKYNYIYLITNTINGKIYIGKHSTDDLKDDYMGSGKILYKAKQKYGLENFTKEYLAFSDNNQNLDYLEKFYIRKYKAQNRNIGYNIASGGTGGITWIGECPNKGRKCSDEAKEKNRIKHLGKVESEEHKQKIGRGVSLALKGKTKKQYKWLTTDGEIKIMNKSNAHQHHPDWKLIEQI